MMQVPHLALLSTIVLKYLHHICQMGGQMLGRANMAQITMFPWLWHKFHSLVYLFCICSSLCSS